MNIRFLGFLLVIFFWVGLLAAEPGFRSVDQRALAAPRRVESSIQDLVAYLCPKGYTDTQKARAIFRWIADRIRYDMEGLKSNKMGTQNAQEVLLRRSGVCEGYSRLFLAMAEEAGLQAAYITGRSHFNDNLPFRLPEGVDGHAWNAVLLDGRWRLLDVTWAAGHADKAGKFVAQFNEFWFNTPPEHFVFTHLPQHERWQLLSSPWTAARFDRTPTLNGHFFRYGLKFTDGLTEPLQVAQELVIRWPAPADVVGISHLVDEKGRALEGWTLTQCPPGFIETRVRTPGSGRYTLKVFARKREPAWKADPKNPGSYDGVASYKVVGQGGAARPFPGTFGSFHRAGAELLAPQEGVLRSRQRYQVRLRVQGAEEVVAFLGSKIVATLKEEGGVYQGWVELPAEPGKLQISARYAQDKRYWALLDYRIQ